MSGRSYLVLEVYRSVEVRNLRVGGFANDFTLASVHDSAHLYAILAEVHGHGAQRVGRTKDGVRGTRVEGVEAAATTTTYIAPG